MLTSGPLPQQQRKQLCQTSNNVNLGHVNSRSDWLKASLTATAARFSLPGPNRTREQL